MAKKRDQVTRVVSGLSDARLTEQYTAIKRQYPDVILFFRLGDFYEAFEEDATIAGDILGLPASTLKNGWRILGIPFFSAQERLEQLIAAGHKVALCEQIANG